MKRFRYGLNCVTHNSARNSDLTPLGYFEVVPGDTISGTVSIQCFSDTLKMVVINRMFADYYAFYVPYRVLDSGFPAFLIEGTGSVPTVANTFTFNFEKQLLLSTHTANVAWLRYCYNSVWNHFFRRSDESEAALTANSVQTTSFRPSTFHESIPEADSTTALTIDTSGPTLSIDDVRETFNKDAFNKTRDLYGDRYTDYLAATGVKANWSIEDSPECIGKSMNTMHITTVDPTPADRDWETNL